MAESQSIEKLQLEVRKLSAERKSLWLGMGSTVVVTLLAVFSSLNACRSSTALMQAETKLAEAKQTKLEFEFDVLSERHQSLQHQHQLLDAEHQHLLMTIDVIRSIARIADDLETSPVLNAELQAEIFRTLGISLDAMLAAESAVARDAANGQARLNLASIYSRLGRYDDAIDEYMIAAELIDFDVHLISHLIESLLHAERLSDANELLQYVLESPMASECVAALHSPYQNAALTHPNDWMAHRGLGLVAYYLWVESGYLDQQFQAEAMRTLAKAVELDPTQHDLRDLLDKLRAGGNP